MTHIEHIPTKRIGYDELARRLRDHYEIQNNIQYNITVNHNYAPEQTQAPQETHFWRDFFIAFFGVLSLILLLGAFHHE